MADVVKENRLVRRNGVYYFRARVPGDLLDDFRKREVKKSLRTGDRATALKDVRIESVKFDAECDALRRAKRPGPDDGEPLAQMSRKDIERIFMRWFAERASQQESYVPRVNIDPAIADEVEATLKDDIVETGPDVPEEYGGFGNGAEDILVAAGVASVPDNRGRASTRRRRLGRRLSEECRKLPTFSYARELYRRALHELAHKAHDRFQGDYSGRVHDALWSGPSIEAARAAKGSVRLKTLVERFLGDPQHDSWAGKTRKSYTSNLGTLQELLTPERDMSLFTPEDSQQLLDDLSALPRNARQRFPNKPLRAILSDPARDKFPAMDPANVNKHMALLSTVLSYGAKCGLVAHSVKSEARCRTSKKSRARREPFSTDDLRRIFQSQKYRDWAVGDISLNPADYFVPIIGLLHGMRLGEICQLECADVRNLDGIWVFDITDQSEDAEFAAVKSVKTRASTRMVPIVPNGLAEVLAARIKSFAMQDETRLFPDIAIASDGTLSSTFSKRFGRRLRGLGIEAKKNGFHRFRHTFRDACRDAGIEASVIDALGGWTTEGVGSSYGAGFSVKRLHEELTRVTFPIQIPGLSYKGE